MSDSDDDEQLKEAIALSLQDQSFSLREGTPAPSSAAPGSVIDLTHSPPDGAGTYTQHIRYAGTSAVTTSVHTDQPKSSSILGLDRKEMEEQRLARKRKAPISPPPARRERPLNGKKVKVMNVSSRPSSQSEEGGMQYPSGVVKKTWAFGYAREGDIKIEEVLQKTDLQLAVLSAFQWDVEWLLRKIALDETKMIFVMQAKEDAVKRQYERETASMSNLRLCFPSMEGVNCMHSKLMLLSHPTHLRVVVPSANLVPFDWGEDGIMENTVFLIDLPRIARHDGTSRDSMTLFGKELIHFIESMGLQQEVIESIYNFDFSGTKDLAFVHSIGGSHSGEEWRRTGYCGLGRAVQMLGLQYEGPLEIDYVSSSIGSLNGDFLKMIYLAAQGDDGMTEYEWRYNKSDQAKRNGGKNEAEREYEDILMAQIRKTCRIYFPTKETVWGGSICLQSKWYTAVTFPRNLMRDCKSQRAGLLMHNKMLFARRQPSSPSTAGQNCPAWAYVGSANLSESAWGRLVKDKRAKTPKLTCRNWECGVLIPVHAIDTEFDVTVPELTCNMELFRGQVPIPMLYPGESYGTRKPWYFTEQ